MSAISDFHDEVRKKIENEEEGYAQSEVGDGLVSYVAGRFPGSVTHAHFLDMPIGKILEDMILDVAREEGRATNRTFARSRLDFMIADREAYPDHWVKKHKEAALLRTLRDTKPRLFY